MLEQCPPSDDPELPLPSLDDALERASSCTKRRYAFFHNFAMWNDLGVVNEMEPLSAALHKCMVYRREIAMSGNVLLFVQLDS
jgi:hypothetical protein